MAESTVFLHVAYLRLAVPSTKTGYLLSVLEAVFAVKPEECICISKAWGILESVPLEFR